MITLSCMACCLTSVMLFLSVLICWDCFWKGFSIRSTLFYFHLFLLLDQLLYCVEIENGDQVLCVAAIKYCFAYVIFRSFSCYFCTLMHLIHFYYTLGYIQVLYRTLVTRTDTGRILS